MENTHTQTLSLGTVRLTAQRERDELPLRCAQHSKVGYHVRELPQLLLLFKRSLAFPLPIDVAKWSVLQFKCRGADCLPECRTAVAVLVVLIELGRYG